MDPPPLGTVGRASSQVDPWHSLIDTITNQLDSQDLETILVRMFGIEDREDDEEEDEGMEIDMDDRDRMVREKFLKKMTSGSDQDQQIKACRLQEVLAEYYENDVQMSVMMQEFMDKYNPVREIDQHEVFVGRDDSVQEITDMLKKRKVLCVSICGIGGQGKSTLARYVCEKLNWVTYAADMRDKHSTSELTKALLMNTDQVLPESEEQLGEDFKKFLSQLTGSTLLYVDDCDEVLSKDSNKFYRFLDDILSFISSHHNEVRFLLTTRKRLEEKSFRSFKEHVRQIELDSLSKPDAIELLCKLSGREIDHTIAEEIVSECACSPIAVTTVADMIKREQFTTERLLFHLKMDKKNVSKAIKIDNCIKTSIDHLNGDARECLVRLSVFQTSPFDSQSAEKVCPKIKTDRGSVSDSISNPITYLQMLYNAHLIDYELSQKDKRKLINVESEIGHTDSETIGLIHLHPLVYKYLQEWRKPKGLEKAFHDATQSFLELYEGKIATLVWNMDTKCVKAMRSLELHRNHIMKFYTILETQKALLKPYPKTSRPKEFLRKKRVSDLGDLLLPDVQKRRLFKSEAGRAKDSGNDAMFIFWTVEEADVYTMLCDKPSIAIDLLDGLSQGKYPALRNLHSDKFYPHLVHALFHKVKGLTRWKQRKPEQGLEHLNLALKFLEHFNLPAEHPEHIRGDINYLNLHARVYSYIGQINLELEKYEAAEEALNKGCSMVRENITSRNESRDMQWDIPRYLGYFGLLKLKKAQIEQNAERRKKLLDDALVDLNKGMDLDRKLKLDNLDGYCMKQKVKADVLIEKRKYETALKEAEAALDKRRAIIQPPHFKYTESVYQVARIYLLNGNELQETGKLDEAKKWWRAASDYFHEMEDHHLVNGSIEVGHPLYWSIKQDHFTARRLYEGENSQQVKELEVFYKRLEKGHFNKRAESHLESFQKMLQTPKEFIQRLFGSGGKEFGENNVTMQAKEEYAGDQIEQMIDGRYGVDRHDSGHASSSSDVGDSISSTEGSGSLSHRVRNLHLEKSISLEDNVFENSGNQGNPERKHIKRQKTISEDQ